MTVIFVFYAIIRFFSAPNEEIPPYMKSLGDWGIAALIFAVMALGVNYLLAGVQIFAKDGIREGRHSFKGFFGNCNRYFLGQLGVSAILYLPAWILALLSVILLSGCAMEAGVYPLTAVAFGASSLVLMLMFIAFMILTCFSWTITAADRTNVFKGIWKSLLFCGSKFFNVLGLMSLLFILMVVVSLVVWIAYAFVVQGLRIFGLDGHVIILREVTGCALNAYFFVFLASSLMAYYLNNRKKDERYN